MFKILVRALLSLGHLLITTYDLQNTPCDMLDTYWRLGDGAYVSKLGTQLLLV